MSTMSGTVVRATGKELRSHLGNVLHVRDHLVVALSLLGELYVVRRPIQHEFRSHADFPFVAYLGHVDIGLALLLLERPQAQRAWLSALPTASIQALL